MVALYCVEITCRCCRNIPNWESVGGFVIVDTDSLTQKNKNKDETTLAFKRRRIWWHRSIHVSHILGRPSHRVVNERITSHYIHTPTGGHFMFTATRNGHKGASSFIGASFVTSNEFFLTCLHIFGLCEDTVRVGNNLSITICAGGRWVLLA